MITITVVLLVMATSSIDKEKTGQIKFFKFVQQCPLYLNLCLLQTDRKIYFFTILQFLLHESM